MAKTFAILNRLSLEKKVAKVAFLDQLNELVRLFKKMSLFGVTRLRTDETFRLEQLDCGIRVDSAIMSLNQIERGLLLKILDTPYTKDDLIESEMSAIVSLTVQTVNERDAFSHELACSYVLKCMTVSLRSSDTWNEPTITIVAKHDLDGVKTIRVPHASIESHLIENWRFLIEGRLGFAQPTLVNPLPNRKLTEFLVSDNWEAFRKHLASMTPQEKTAELSSKADMVARANGYAFDEKVSTKNGSSTHMRRIYQYADASFVVYVSVDFETPAGAFEVFDRNGIHVGEVLFSGRWNKEADKTGRHDIRL